MALRLAGEEYSVVQGLDSLGWPRKVQASDSIPALNIVTSGTGLGLKLASGNPVNAIGAQGLFAGESEISTLWITGNLRANTLKGVSPSDLRIESWQAGSGRIRLGTCYEVVIEERIDLQEEIRNTGANFNGRVYVNDSLEATGKIYADGGIDLASQTFLLVGVYSDATRPAPGTAGRVIYNTTDANLNIDNGTNWILPNGTVT
ncbi:MAG: hypothetical protein HY666_04650 [Chloroflexi bacterium]|nr:hypothetical protein [Chloroflexota bacterium]